MYQTFLTMFPRVVFVAIAACIGADAVCVAGLGSAGMIVSVASIADWLNFLFRCFLIVRIFGVIFCYFNLLMSILVMVFTILEEFFHSFGVIRAVMLRS